MKILSSQFLVCNLKFNHTGILLVLILQSFSLWSQIIQPACYERAHKESDHEFIIISLGEHGLALVRDTEKIDDGKKHWEMILLDTALQEIWSSKIEIEYRMNILGHEYRDGNIYLIFQEPDASGGQFNLTEIGFIDKAVKQHKFKPEVNISFSHFSVMKNKAIFGGYIAKEPALLMYDLDKESAKVIPGIFQPNIELMDVRTNSNDTFNALLVERKSKNGKKLTVRTYDANGVMLVDDVIAVEGGKSILEAMTSTLVQDELVIIGTWTFGTNKQSSGIFSVVVDPFTDQKINYYDYAELNHFLDYLKPRKAAKIKAKAEWRRSVGKQPEFRTYLSSIKIEEHKDGFYFLSEVYDPPTSYYNNRYNSPYNYSQYPYSPYGGYSPYGFNSMPYRYYNSPYSTYNTVPYSNSPPTIDIRVLHSSLTFFDTHGKLISDQSLKFSEIKSVAKQQVSDFIISNGQVTMTCKEEKEIVMQVSDPDGTVVKQEKAKPELKKADETIRSESHEDSSIRMWYGSYFYVYGYHTIRDKEKNSHNVFYVNKVKAG